MAIYKYTAIDAHGDEKTGEVEAETQGEAINLIRGKSFVPIKVQCPEDLPEVKLRSGEMAEAIGIIALAILVMLLKYGFLLLVGIAAIVIIFHFAC